MDFTPLSSLLGYLREAYVARRDRKHWRAAMAAEAAKVEREMFSMDDQLQAYYLAQDLGFSPEDALAMSLNPAERRLFL